MYLAATPSSKREQRGEEVEITYVLVSFRIKAVDVAGQAGSTYFEYDG
jgi:hypothetical protein